MAKLRVHNLQSGHPLGAGGPLLRTGIGATIMGRNMFGPVRGLDGDEVVEFVASASVAHARLARSR